MTFDRYLEVKALSRFAAEMEPAGGGVVFPGGRGRKPGVELFIALHRKTADGGGVKKDERGFVGRHKAGVAALIALALLGALAVVLWQAGAA
jgi:hypothetical protein